MISKNELRLALVGPRHCRFGKRLLAASPSSVFVPQPAMESGLVEGSFAQLAVEGWCPCQEV